MDNLSYLFVAFALTWVLIFGYVLMLGARLGRITKALRPDEDDKPGEEP